MGLAAALRLAWASTVGTGPTPPSRPNPKPPAPSRSRSRRETPVASNTSFAVIELPPGIVPRSVCIDAANRGRGAAQQAGHAEPARGCYSPRAMPNRRCFSLYWSPAVIALAGLSPAANGQVVTVTVEPPIVERVEFDRRQPPPDMPSTMAERSGVCRNVFEIEASIASSIELLAPTTVRAYPENFDIITRLEVTIYTAKGSPAKLQAHEEGHRAIGEHYYGGAGAAARAAALSLVGRSFEASGPNRAAAEQAAGELILAALKEAFMQRTHARSAAANARYDAISDHGLNAIGEKEAIAAAIAHDP